MRGKMLWLLMIIHLGGDPVSVRHAEIGQTFYSEQDCIKHMREIFQQAKQQKQPVPSEVNMGCVVFNAKGA